MTEADGSPACGKDESRILIRRTSALRSITVLCGIIIGILGPWLALNISSKIELAPAGWIMALLSFVAGISVFFITRRPAMMAPLAGLAFIFMGWILAEWISQACHGARCICDRVKVFSDRIRNPNYPEEGELRGPLTLAELKSFHERLARYSPNWMTCPNTGSDYEWSCCGRDFSSRGLAVWDGKPHGYLLKYRSVVYMNGRGHRYTESQFQNLIK